MSTQKAQIEDLTQVVEQLREDVDRMQQEMASADHVHEEPVAVKSPRELLFKPAPPEQEVATVKVDVDA